MPFMLNVQYGQQYPAVYVDEVRALRNGERVGLTLFVVSKELPREKVTAIEQRLGRKTDQLERDGIYALQILEYQNEVLIPMADYLASILVGERNVNLERENSLPYKLQAANYGTIDNFSGSQRGVLNFYNEAFTKMNLIGVTLSLEVSGGNSNGVFCQLPHKLKTDWNTLNKERSLFCNPKPINEGCKPTPELPEGAILIDKHNFPTAFSMSRTNTGRYFYPLLSKWHYESDYVLKLGYAAQIEELLVLDKELPHYELGRQGDLYYVIIKEAPF